MVEKSIAGYLSTSSDFFPDKRPPERRKYSLISTTVHDESGIRSMIEGVLTDTEALKVRLTAPTHDLD